MMTDSPYGLRVSVDIARQDLTYADIEDRLDHAATSFFEGHDASTITITELDGRFNDRVASVVHRLACRKVESKAFGADVVVEASQFEALLAYVERIESGLYSVQSTLNATEATHARHGADLAHDPRRASRERRREREAAR